MVERRCTSDYPSRSHVLTTVCPLAVIPGTVHSHCARALIAAIQPCHSPSSRPPPSGAFVAVTVDRPCRVPRVALRTGLRLLVRRTNGPLIPVRGRPPCTSPRSAAPVPLRRSRRRDRRNAVSRQAAAEPQAHRVRLPPSANVIGLSSFHVVRPPWQSIWLSLGPTPSRFRCSAFISSSAVGAGHDYCVRTLDGCGRASVFVLASAVASVGLSGARGAAEREAPTATPVARSACLRRRDMRRLRGHRAPTAGDLHPPRSNGATLTKLIPNTTSVATSSRSPALRSSLVPYLIGLNLF